MSAPPPNPLTQLLQPLLDALTRGRFARLSVRPGRVIGDRPEAEPAAPLDMIWSPEQHREALAALPDSSLFESGVAVQVLGDTLLFKAPPDVLWRPEDLAREGWLSSLAARLLSATLGLGRNILVTGPWSVCAQICATLVGEGQRPALLADGCEALPGRWVQARSPREVQSLGADRIAAWSLPPSALVQAMGQLSGIIGWLDARRLDRALVRYEAGAEAATGRGNTPLQVLAGLDLVVVASLDGGPRVREVAEITLVEEGYRPSLIFASGLQPAPTALVPLGAPSFVEELDRAGHGVLADELRHLGHNRARPPASPPVRPGRPPPPAMRAPPPRAMALAEDVPRPQVTLESVADLSPPGWELDRLGDAALSPEDMGSGNAEDAGMAATYGLGPPPRPAARPVAAGFSDVLREAGEPHQPELPDDTE